MQKWGRILVTSGCGCGYVGCTGGRSPCTDSRPAAAGTIDACRFTPSLPPAPRGDAGGIATCFTFYIWGFAVDRDLLVLLVGMNVGAALALTGCLMSVAWQRRRQSGDTSRLLRRLIMQNLDAQQMEAASRGYIMSGVADIKSGLERLAVMVARLPATKTITGPHST